MTGTEIENGMHFWGIFDGRSAIFIKHEGLAFICGPWEIPVFFEDIEMIGIIEVPDKIKNTVNYFKP